MSTLLNRSVDDDIHSIPLVPAIEGGEIAVEDDVGSGVWVKAGAGVCVVAVTNSAVEVGSGSEQADKIYNVIRTMTRMQVCFIQIPLSKSSELDSISQSYHLLNV